MQDTIKIIYQDDELLVINKPSGILSIPDGYDPNLPHIKSILFSDFGDLYIVHRLDKETSGLMILCRTPYSHQAINRQFENRLVHKEYHALVYSLNEIQPSFSVELPLKINADRYHRTRVSIPQGKSAKTDFQVINKFTNIFLLSAHPFTGYTHQIRAHLYSQEIQILGDPLYTLHDEKCEALESSLGISRLMLHARKIELKHPITNEPISFTAEYPPDFITLLDILKTTEPKH